MKLNNRYLLLFVAIISMAVILTQSKASTCYSAKNTASIKQCKEEVEVAEVTNEDLKLQLLFKF